MRFARLHGTALRVRGACLHGAGSSPSRFCILLADGPVIRSRILFVSITVVCVQVALAGSPWAHDALHLRVVRLHVISTFLWAARFRNRGVFLPVACIDGAWFLFRSICASPWADMGNDAATIAFVKAAHHLHAHSKGPRVAFRRRCHRCALRGRMRACKTLRGRQLSALRSNRIRIPCLRRGFRSRTNSSAQPSG